MKQVITIDRAKTKEIEDILNKAFNKGWTKSKTVGGYMGQTSKSMSISISDTEEAVSSPELVKEVAQQLMQRILNADGTQQICVLYETYGGEHGYTSELLNNTYLIQNEFGIFDSD